MRERLRAVMRHMKFALDLCLRQCREGRLFFVHPAGATSWSTAMMQQMLALEGVHAAKFDFCMLGMTTTNRKGDSVAAKKRTTVMTSSGNIGKMMRRVQCDGSHRNEPLHAVPHVPAIPAAVALNASAGAPEWIRLARTPSVQHGRTRAACVHYAMP